MMIIAIPPSCTEKPAYEIAVEHLVQADTGAPSALTSLPACENTEQLQVSAPGSGFGKM